MLTVEEIALCLQDLVHVAHPGPADVHRERLQDEADGVAISTTGRQSKAGRVAIYTRLHAQTTHLKHAPQYELVNTYEQRLFYDILCYDTVTVFLMIAVILLSMTRPLQVCDYKSCNQPKL